MRNHIAPLLFTLSLSFFVASCDDKTTGPITPNVSTVNGAPVSVGNGTATPYVSVDASGKPLSHGIALTDGALTGLPQEGHGWEYTLPMPQAGSGTGVDHISLEYNPKGHEPDGLYTIEHFDFHFYQLTGLQRDSIPAGPDITPVDPKYIPKDHKTFDNFSIPRMGVHYIDTTSGELHGHVFDKTFIFGFTRGNLAFLEPMITVDYLKKKQTFTAVVKQPQSWKRTGISYPTKYSIRYEAASKTTFIELHNLVKH